MIDAALAYAEAGWPVFRLRPGTKEPFHGSRGFYDATTDQETIRRWWAASPDANIGTPTGKRTGILALDQDHPAALDALEAEHGDLPATRTHGTGSGGMHYLYRYPSEAGQVIRNSAGKLGEGLDVRGEGGYIVLPPSRTTRPYEVLDALTIAEAPGWLLEALTRKPTPSSSAAPAGDSLRAVADVGGGKIPVGRRNVTLTSICGLMHDGTRDLAALTADLMAVNEARCAIPLPAAEVEKIARSIHAKEPCKQKAPKPDEEALATLAEIMADVEASPWVGMGGKGERDVVIALSWLIRSFGRSIPAGVRISVDFRTLALVAAMSLAATHRAVQRLRLKGFISYDNEGRSRRHSGALVLRARQVEHSPTRLRPGGEEASGSSVPPCAERRYTAPRLRWSAPRWERVGDEMVRGTVVRLGKSSGHAIDVLEHAGGELDIGDLYGLINPHKDRADRRAWRPRDLWQRTLPRLVAARVIEVRGTTVALVDGWLENLNEERELAGEIEAYRLDMARYERDRRLYREHLDGEPEKPEEAPLVEREDEPLAADGLVSELEPVEEDRGHAQDEPSELARAVRARLDLNPHEVRQPPGWIANTLWAYSLVAWKPTPDDVCEALEELHGYERKRAA